MKKYTKRPVTIEAVKVTDATFDSPHPNNDHVVGVTYDPVGRCFWIDTLKGVVSGHVGDWIIRGVKGELYPCRDDIFRMTYDEVDAP